MDRPVRANTRLMQHMVKRGPDRGYFPKPEKSIHIYDNPSQVEATQVAFLELCFKVKFHDGYCYVGNFIGSTAQREDWVAKKVEAWSDGVRTFASFAHRYPQTAYAGLTMSLQGKWQYLQRMVPDMGNLVGPIEEALWTEFFLA
eukprot:315055-Ditylum_brightwellii.AAC.1